MAVESFTVGDLLNRLAFWVEGANSADAVLRPNYLAGLQSALVDLVYECDLNTFQTRGTITFSAAGGEYTALPDDFDHFLNPYIVYTANPQDRVHYVTPEEFDRKSLEEVYGTTTGKPRLFTLRGTNIHAGATHASSSGSQQIIVHPTPDATYAARYWYYARPSNFESDTDGTTIVDKRFPEQFKYAILHSALVEFFDRMIDRQEVQVHEKKLMDWKRKIRLWNSNPVASMSHRRERVGMVNGRLYRPGDRWNGSSTTPWQNPS